ncbi:PREDICTED: division abnormally delayed protein [Vollenhovia emeryi]|uniref:division abnormally delayed protein n=1 Tax=Vollenhovia emeryi TaxID=411798 RepID=UPI0005F579B6|nr:PREDICTED: division abnormally delayed protein [Vollenhovia emeryi]
MMKITPRAASRGLPASSLLLAVLVWCHCVCSIAHAKSHHLRTTSNDTEQAVDCELVRPFFDTKNITLAPAAADSPKTICGGKCCGAEMEERLKEQARTDFHSLIHHHSRSLQGLLATTVDALKETMIVLLRRSENTTVTMFDQVYRSMAPQSRPSIRAFYQSMIDYVSSADDTSDDPQQRPPLTRETLQERINEFFTRLFPIAYHYAINPNGHRDWRDFTEKFKSCLYERIDDIQPFGETPQEVLKIGKSLDATRILVEALTLGKTVLDRTDRMIFNIGKSPQQDACYDALLRMTYCPKCKGIGKTVRPCGGFCTNVVRGCLTEPASDLDLAWSGYVDTVERLVAAISGKSDHHGLNVRSAVRDLDSRISDAIMHAMENGPLLEEKVRKVCGRSELLPPEEKSPVSSDAAARSSPSSSGVEPRHAAAPSSHAQDDLVDQLHKQLANFLASVVRSRIFYGTLADAICEDYPDKRCWNGERVGEYTKTVVDSSLNAQRYNPEFTITMSSTPATYSGNVNTSALIDQLRHINQVVQTQLVSDLGPDGFLADEAGSGSGDSAVWRPHGNGEIDDDEDGRDRDDDDEASGSGMGPTTTDTSMKPHPNGPLHAGSSTVLLSSAVLAIVCASLIA